MRDGCHAAVMGESRMSRADRRSEALLRRCGTELRDARRSAGLTLASVAAASRCSESEVSRIERGRAPWVSVTALSRVAAVVGLDLWTRLYPGSDALRDAGHLRLESAFRDRIGAGLRVAAEVPVGDGRDQRAWDLVLADRSGSRAGVELDTRLTDVQAYLRRLALKRRDGDVDRLIVVLADSRSNRAVVDAGRAAIESTLRIEPGGAWPALTRGELPADDVLLFVRAVVPREQAIWRTASQVRPAATRQEGSDPAA